MMDDGTMIQRQASEMEKHVKDMMEAEGRACGIELDKRKNARGTNLQAIIILMHQLMEWRSVSRSTSTMEHNRRCRNDLGIC